MQNSFNDTSSQNSTIKGLLIAFFLFLTIAGGYIYKQTVDLKLVKIENSNLDRDKIEFLNKLSELEATYENALADNTSISSELIAEKDKVNQLMEEIEKSKPDLAELSNFRQRIAVYENKMKDLILQVSSLRRENSILKMQRDSSIFVLREYEKTNKTFYDKSGELDKSAPDITENLLKARIGTELLWSIKIFDLKVKSYIKIVNKEPFETRIATKVNLLKLGFIIPQNFVIRASLRSYFIQILNEKGNLICDNSEVIFDDNSKLNYTYKISVPYKNKKIEVVENIFCKNFKKGLYTVNVYDSNILIDKTTILLNN